MVGGRYRFDPFVGSDLEELPRGRGMRTALFAGFATDQCPAGGLCITLGKGVEGHLVSDCTATFTGPQQRRAEKQFGRCTVPCREVADALAPGQRGVRAGTEPSAAQGRVAPREKPALSKGEVDGEAMRDLLALRRMLGDEEPVIVAGWAYSWVGTSCASITGAGRRRWTPVVEASRER